MIMRDAVDFIGIDIDSSQSVNIFLLVDPFESRDDSEEKLLNVTHQAGSIYLPCFHSSIIE